MIEFAIAFTLAGWGMVFLGLIVTEL